MYVYSIFIFIIIKRTLLHVLFFITAFLKLQFHLHTCKVARDGCHDCLPALTSNIQSNHSFSTLHSYFPIHLLRCPYETTRGNELITWLNHSQPFSITSNLNLCHPYSICSLLQHQSKRLLQLYLVSTAIGRYDIVTILRLTTTL